MALWFGLPHFVQKCLFPSLLNGQSFLHLFLLNGLHASFCPFFAIWVPRAYKSVSGATFLAIFLVVPLIPLLP